MREALDASIDKPVSVQDLLSGFDCTYEHANRSFKAIFGVAPIRYLTVARIERARGLLAQGRPMARVASACGFASVGYLARVFRQHTGITPGAYQKATVG